MQVERIALVEALKSVMGVATSGAPNVSLIGVDGTLSIVAGASQERAWADIVAEGDPVSVSVPGKKLLEILSNSDAATAEMKVGDGFVAVNAGFRAKLNTMATVPGMPKMIAGDCPKAAADDLAWVSLASSTEDARYAIKSVMIDGEHVVATDGRRLHMANAAGGDRSLLIPREAARHISRGFADAEWSTDGDMLQVVEGSRGCQFGLAAGQFPPYKDVVPQYPDGAAITLTVDADAFADVLSQSLVTAENNRVSLSVNVQVRIESQSPEVGESSIECEVEDVKGEVVIGFHGGYMRDAIRGMGRAVLEMASEKRPIKIRQVGGDRVAVVMPVSK